MNSDTTAPRVAAELDESAISRAELHIEREKIEIERERLALERERMAAERERWKSESEWKARAEGRGVTFSTLVLIGMVCLLGGVLAGFFAAGPGGASRSARLESLATRASTNATGMGASSFQLRPLDAGGGSKAYLLILD
ncbi:MAG: hypothetical protein WCR06_04445 [bacterium]